MKLEVSTIEESLKQKVKQNMYALASRDSVRDELGRLENREKELKEEIDTLEKVAILFQQLSDLKRTELQKKVETLVGFGLKVIFQEDIKFLIESEVKGNNISFEFKLETNGQKTGIFDCRGGGIISVVSYLLRVIMLLMVKPQLRKVLFLDEPFSMLSEEYRNNMKTLLQTLSQKTGIQHVIVTHLPEIAECGDIQYMVELVNGHSKVSRTV
ncbi:MAG: hypothetical protein NT162_02470 [Candidatus Woesebacteria bacterium]|nr:hypothetical protein [Candidatus Woesebacteria bacterium]